MAVFSSKRTDLFSNFTCFFGPPGVPRGDYETPTPISAAWLILAASAMDLFLKLVLASTMLLDATRSLRESTTLSLSAAIALKN